MRKGYKMEADNKNEQKTTKSNVTGLTPLQEQACMMLASGEGITAVAEKLSLNRGTLYKWQHYMAFQCFYNQQCQDYKSEVKNALMGMHAQAIATVGELLETGNESTRLKAAMWLLEKVEAVEVGDTDIRAVLKAQCSHSLDDWGDFAPQLNEREYKKALNYYGLSED